MTSEQMDSLLRAYGELQAQNATLTARLEAVTAALGDALIIAEFVAGEMIGSDSELRFAHRDMARLLIGRARAILAAGQTAPAADEVRRGRFVPRESDHQPAADPAREGQG